VQAKTAATVRAAALAEVLKASLEDDASVIAGLQAQMAECTAAESLKEFEAEYEKVAAQYNYWSTCGSRTST